MAKQSVQQNEGNGFKTVAFGFDKNDVTLYIGALRKKMTATEQEYEDKIAQLEIKLNKANNAVNNSQQETRNESANKAKIDELTAEVEALKLENEKITAENTEKDNSIKKLELRLSELENVPTINTTAGSADTSLVLKIAYEHIDELNRVAEEFKDKITKLQYEPTSEMVHIEQEPLAEKATPTAEIKTVGAEKQNASNNDLSKPEASFAIDDADFADLLATPESDDDLSSSIDLSIKPEDDIDLMQLLADDKDNAKGEDLVPVEPKAAEQKGNDLGNDLYEILINPEDSGTDLFDLLEQKKAAESAENNELEIKPAEIDKTLEITNEFSDLMAVDNEAATDNEWTAHEAIPKKTEDEMFDFNAFAADEEQSDDDMSTNVMPNIF